jgi:predicted phage gp36 major capsid-like protein
VHVAQAENVVSYLPKAQQDAWRAKLQPTYEAAWAELRRLHQELKRVNEDAARSLAEGLEETLTLHRLGVAEALRGSLGGSVKRCGLSHQAATSWVASTPSTYRTPA